MEAENHSKRITCIKQLEPLWWERLLSKCVLESERARERESEPPFHNTFLI